MQREEEKLLLTSEDINTFRLHELFLFPSETTKTLKWLVGKKITSININTGKHILALCQQEIRKKSPTSALLGQYLFEIDRKITIAFAQDLTFGSITLFSINAKSNSDEVKSKLETISKQTKRFPSGGTIDISNEYNIIGTPIKNITVFKIKKESIPYACESMIYFDQNILKIDFDQGNHLVISYNVKTRNSNSTEISICEWADIDLDQGLPQVVWTANEQH